MMQLSSIEYRNWLAGRLPEYRPSRGDLFLAAGGVIDV